MTTLGWAPPERVFHERARAELSDGIAGVDIKAGPLTVRAGSIPLFRQAAGGVLEQALRLVVTVAAETPEARFTLEAGSTVLDSVTRSLKPGREVLRLFVPEVSGAVEMTLTVAVAGAEPVRTPLSVAAQRKWDVYLIQQTHVDIGYTDPQGMVARHHRHYLDSVLDLVSVTDGWPEPSRFRWNVECTWPLRDWMSARPEASVRALLDRMREGRIEVSALSFNMHTEAYSIDELARQIDFGIELRERHRVPVVTAMQTDVPGATQALVDLLADAGVRYLAVAHNFAGRAVPFLADGQRLERPFRWRSLSGKEVLVWYTDSAHGLYTEGNVVGLAESYDLALELLPEYLVALATRPYPYLKIDQAMTWPGLPYGVEPAKPPYPHDLLHLRVQGLIADNAPPSLTPSAVARNWNQAWAYPRLRVATNCEFFGEVERRLGGELPTFTGDWTDWWADGLGSAAREGGFNRRAKCALPAAQTLHTLADLLETADEDAWRAALEAAYENAALFDEHTWGAAEPWADGLERRDSGALQWRVKAGFADRAYQGSLDLLDAGIQRLAPLLGASGHPTVTVFNPSSMSRTDIVEVFLPESRFTRGGRLELRDETTGDLVAHTVAPQRHERHRPRGARLIFVAAEVPSFGYARYSMAEVEGPVAESAASSEMFLENEHIRVELDAGSGCVRRFLDRELGCELVDPSQPVAFNQYVHDRYAVAAHIGYLSSRVSGGADWLLGSRASAGQGVVVRRTSTSVFDEITLRLVADGCTALETTYRLVRDLRRLDIENRLFKIASPDKESSYFAFPFDLREAKLRYEITGGVDGPDLPRVPGSATHTRAIRHWVTLADGRATVAWATREAALVQFANIYLPYSPFPATIHPAQVGSATIFSWVTNNIWDTNFPVQQGGEMLFSYAVSTADPGADAATLGARTAAGLAQPLIGILSTPTDAPNRQPARGCFCALDRGDVDAVGLAPSRRGHDLVLHLRSLAEAEVEVGLSFPALRVRAVHAGTFLEERMQPLTSAEGRYRLVMRPGEYRAIAVDLEP